MALPGAYSIRLSVDGKTFSQPLTVVKDPRTTASLGDLRKQLERDLGLQQCATRTYEAHEQVVSLRAALKDALASPDKAVADAAKAYDTKLAAIEGKVSYERRFFLGSDFSDCVNANINLLQLFYQLDTGDGAPTEAVWRTYAEAIRSTQKLLDQWKSLNGQPLSDCNAALTKAGLKPVAAAPALGPLPITPAWLRQTATPGTRPAS